MLLNIQNIGTKDRARFYRVQSPTGYHGLIALTAAHVKHDQAPRVEIRLSGTAYLREYPASGKLDRGQAPRISDLAGGYQTVAAFWATWEYSTAEQRADLSEYDKRIAGGKGLKYNPFWKTSHDQYRRTDRTFRKRHKWTTRTIDDRPRVIEGTEAGDGWIKVYTKELRQALKGTRSAVRIADATIKPTILRQLCKIHGPVVELSKQPAGLGFRSVDVCKKDGMDTIEHKTQCTIHHGAGDPYAGRNGFEARVTFARAS